MSNSISQDFKPLSLLKFAMPSMIMMIFMSLYTIVDGIFVSRLIGSNALSAVNIVWPVLSVSNALGIMLASGGSAVIATKLGEGKAKDARENFSFLVVTGLLISLLLLVLTILFLDPIVNALGANETLYDYCCDYLKFSIIFAPACMLQNLFQCFFVTAGKPGLGLSLTVIAGLANAFLDYFFMGVLNMGVSGAALATGSGQMIPAIAGLIYFFYAGHRLKSTENDSNHLYFTGFHYSGQVLLASCANGSSEMVSNLSNAIVTYLFNIILMRLAGEDGVAAITIILYGQFLFNALYLGFSIGVGPVISFNYGAQNKRRLQTVYKICTAFVLLSSVIIGALAFFSADFISAVFVEKGNNTFSLTATGFAIFAVNYLFSGYNIFSSGLFTALSDGKTSAILSLSRTFVFIFISLLIFPQIWDITGVWIAVPVAEFMTLFLSVYFHFKNRRIFL